MIYFFSDSHFEKHCGANLYKHFPAELKERTVFTENQWDILENGDWEKNCELLILNMIGTTCNQPHASGNAENAVRKYVERGGNILMLHGSSAAFWHWSWWRNLCGFRWVRPNDPDNVERSIHPVRTFTTTVAKTRHTLIEQLKPFTLENDEIYIRCEQTLPMTVLMETNTDEGIYPQCVECITPYGGRQLIFLPGHRVESFENPEFIADNMVLINYLLNFKQISDK